MITGTWVSTTGKRFIIIIFFHNLENLFWQLTKLRPKLLQKKIIIIKYSPSLGLFDKLNDLRTKKLKLHL